MRSIFSGAADLSRINPAGIVLMAIAVLGVILARSLAGRVSAGNAQGTENAIRIISLIICAGGALLAILG